jgi:hypothetical protein
MSFAQICLASDDNIKILINIPSRTLEVINNGKVENSYSIGIGKPNFPTPTGNYKVITKIINPNWENPYKPAGESKIKAGKANPLGTRWIGFVRNNNGEYGIHGTNNPLSVGNYSSHGCIRMKIKDAENLFAKVNIGTEIYIRNYPYKVFIQNNKLIVKKYKNLYKTAVNKKESIEEQLELFNTGYNIDQKKIDALKSTSEIGNTFAVKDKPGFKYIYSDFMANFD